MPVGHVYVLVNHAFPGLVKIGCTGGSPEERARQLSATTGVPQPYIVVYSAQVVDMESAEQRVHTVLESRGLRITPNREFFQATPTDAIDALLLVLRDIDRATGNVSSPQSEQNADEAERLREAAWAVAVGADDTLLDIPEAIRLYKLAIAHGSRQADLELGRIYAHQSGLLIVNLALIHLKRTAEANVPRAWAILADAFGRSGSI